MTQAKDPLLEIEERYKRLRMNKPLQSGEVVIDPLQVLIDIKFLLALVRAYEDKLLHEDRKHSLAGTDVLYFNMNEWIKEIKSKIFPTEG